MRRGRPKPELNEYEKVACPLILLITGTHTKGILRYRGQMNGLPLQGVSI
jgi:hypothetical protein